jgi:ribonuclease-3
MHNKTFSKFSQNIPQIEHKLGYTFANKSLLTLAFTHRSFTNEFKELELEHNERLEFLGDSILGTLVTSYLYLTLPDASEGQLSQWRSRLVEANTCIHYLEKLGVGSFLLLGRGEQQNSGKGRASLFADLFEALIGAIYLDGGLEAAKKIFLSHFQELISTILQETPRNWKAELQDLMQRLFHVPPHYELLNEEGPEHNKAFTIQVFLNEELLGQGIGSSKKEAQQEAAKNAVLAIEGPRGK